MTPESSVQTITAAAQALRAGSASAASLVEASLAAIDRSSEATNAFIRVDADGARAAGAQADAERARGIDRGPLHGIPISVKDIIDVAGQPTTAASKVFADRLPDRDATAVARLREAGAIVLGKTNLHEIALGTTSEASAFGAVRNPHDRLRSPGGSSGGSAAAVATGMGLASIGTDTGGSIRIPAAACGVVGLKPAFGEVPTTGVVPLSFSLDHVGPLTRTVSDAAWVWAALAGVALEAPAPPAPATLRLNRLDGYFGMIDRDVRTAFDEALSALSGHDVVIRGIEIPEADAIATVYVSVALPEAFTWHEPHLLARSADYTPEVRARLEIGRSIRAVDYLKAQHAREALRRAVGAALQSCDALLLPALPIVAPLLGAKEAPLGDGRDSTLPIRSAMLRQTQLFNLTGHPAISLPLKTRGLPAGLQLVGPLDSTRRLLDVAAAIEAIVSPPIQS
jgi:aspartyl-tRNA(Asn)/glutamyl-tRNA(Gln) amidotransferase subunit A